MSSNLQFVLAEPADYQKAFPLIKLLNPDLDAEQFVAYSQEMQQLGNYWLYFALNDAGELVGVCGYWIAVKYYTGKYMEIDNFVINPDHRNVQYGSDFIAFLEAKAREIDCKTIMLDAYVENFNGHRFYYRNGFIARGFHYLKHLS